MTLALKTKGTIAQALYGDIVLGEDKDGKLFAVKQISLKHARARRTISNQARVREDVFTERLVNQKLGHHPSICEMVDSYEQDGILYMVFEYCSKGDLYDLAVSQDISNQKIQMYFRQLVEGVQFLHHRNVAHRDLSLENVLINEEGHVKICDFGLVSELRAVRNECVGKLFYMAPEVYAGDNYDPGAADMWSLGVMLFILLTGLPLVETPSRQDHRLAYVMKHGVRALLKCWKKASSVPDEAIDLLEKLLVFDPSQRMKIDELARHPWVNPLEEKRAIKKPATLHKVWNKLVHLGHKN